MPGIQYKKTFFRVSLDMYVKILVKSKMAGQDY